jgi:glutamate/tyrosine decarboxylase-like PLP-dependent enzyme
MLDPQDSLNLDPRTETEWEAFRQAGYRILDATLARHRELRSQPCWAPPSAEARATFQEPAPTEGLGLEAVLAKAEQGILSCPTGNLHPRFWGWVLGAGNLPGMLGQWLAASMNANVFAGDQGPVHLEQQVLGWFKDWFEFPAGASGILTGGGSMANFLALAVARHWATQGAVKAEGPRAAIGLRIYASDATHNSILKGAQFLGLGGEGVHRVATDPQGRIDLEALAQAVVRDREAGLRPFCLVANAGTVGVGALDPLEALRTFADRNQLWLHVDGAIGALGWMSPKLRPRLQGLTCADSLAFDLHKWGQVPYDAGCLLVRDGDLHRDTFQSGAEYLSTLEGGLTPHGSHAFNAFSPLLSRGDRALKIWMTFQALGTARLAGVFDKNVAQASHLGERVAGHPDLELMSPVALNIVCFRYRGRLAPAELDRTNERILVSLQESGFCVLSHNRIRGEFCLRVAISNPRTEGRELVERVVALGARAQGGNRVGGIPDPPVIRL